MSIDLRIAERVAKGVELLDWASPGWAAKINLHKLDLNNCDECILGQLFGEYEYGLAELPVPPAGHGFCSLTGGLAGQLTVEEEFKALTTEWKRLIRRRRAAAEIALGPDVRELICV